MRDRWGKPLGVSYTEDGLKLVCNSDGRMPYYNKAILRANQGETPGYTITGDLRKNPNIIVEKFVPRDHKNPRIMQAEIQFVDKALRMLYVQKRYEPS